jgi:hypothetical protein
MDHRSHGPVKSLAAYNAYKECAWGKIQRMVWHKNKNIFTKSKYFLERRTLILNN